ncbi:class I SAM-dependent methyltransferase [Acidisoma sp.]|uniref:class I SAM-dependent methyltransferase n=1 Tax=Acidisoma sp. TaxID=1872115 RepID=UPI003B00B8CC
MQPADAAQAPAAVAASEPRIAPGLAGVPETMLWSLHNRACEARRDDAILIDPHSLTIHAAMQYDFARHFGDPGGSLAVRAAAIDRAVRLWLETHPDGLVVSLGEGLETQAQRVDNGRMRWLSVDLPEAIRLRERFIAPTGRFRHVAASALDAGWMDEVDDTSGLFVVAQGLLMYLDPASVRRLLAGIAERFPGVELVFDVVPPWFSRLTVIGFQQTPHYRLPVMPWGIGRDDIAATLRGWHWRFADCVFLEYGAPRGWPLLVSRLMHEFPTARHELPCLVHVTTLTGDRSFPMNVETTSPASIGGVLAAATLNASRSGDLALAASQVVAKRVALGVAGALNPAEADHAEFARMVPEKIDAFSAVGAVLRQQTDHVARAFTRLASDEMQAAAQATISLAGCTTPGALAAAQRAWMVGWFERAAANVAAMGMLTVQAQEAAMAPLHSQVAANVDRLTV